MKKILLILSLFFLTSLCVFAQNEEGGQESSKVQERLNEYLQKRLGLTKSEADKFSPVYLRYFNELRKTHQESKDLPPIDRQQKILEIRLRYRNEFKPILGEKRANNVFIAEQEFIQKVREVHEERLGHPNKNFRSLLQ